MKKLTYTLIAEGHAEYAFVEKLIESIAGTYNLQTKKTPLKISASANPSKSKVLAEINTFCNRSFQPAVNADLFIAGVDLDEADHSLERHNQEIQEIKSKLGKLHTLYGEKIILFVPIQAIDYWILYLKENSTPNSLESKDKKQVKEKAFGSRANRHKIEKSVNQIMQDANLENLTKQSKSFKVFYQQLDSFLKSFK
jgi:hypothetical protein